MKRKAYSFILSILITACPIILYSTNTSINDFNSFIETAKTYQTNNSSQNYNILISTYNKLSEHDKEQARNYLQEHSININPENTLNMADQTDTTNMIERSKSFNSFTDAYYDYEENTISFEELLDSFNQISNFQDKLDAQNYLQAYCSTLSQEDFKKIDRAYINYLLPKIITIKNQIEDLNQNTQALQEKYNEQQQRYNLQTEYYQELLNYSKNLNNSLESINNQINHTNAHLNSYSNFDQAQEQCIILEQQIKQEREYIRALQEKIKQLTNY